MRISYDNALVSYATMAAYGITQPLVTVLTTIWQTI